MHLRNVFASAGLLIFAVNSALAQAALFKRADGVPVAAIVDLPAGTAKVPAVVLAPGQGYHMTLSLLEATAKALTEQGIAVFRFNWTYFTSEPKGQPSQDLSVELQDLQTVVAAARAHARVDAGRVSVGGKSLGSVVAWSAFVADPQLRSALLLTPICSRVPKGESSPRSEATENYPGLPSERRPSLWITGDADPLCDPASLYTFAAGGARSTRVAVVGGDHGFENRALPAIDAETFLTGNLRAAAALSAGFVAEASRPRQ